LSAAGTAAETDNDDDDDDDEGSDGCGSWCISAPSGHGCVTDGRC